MKSICLAAAAAAIVVAAPASAATYLYSFTSSALNGSGTFVTEDTTTAGVNGREGYLITSITGGTVTIVSSGRTTAATLLPTNSYVGNDNILYTTGDALDQAGVSFSFGALGGMSGNVYHSVGYLYISTNMNAQIGSLLTFTITPTATAAVPEPASWAMLMSGFGLVGGGLRRRAARVKFQAI